jgi:hypothetical protein
VVVVLRCTAHTADGTIVASRAASIHVAGAPGKPATRGEARELASRTIERAHSWTAVIPGLAEWFETVQRQHGTSIDAMHNREELLRAALPGEQEQVQPGLFDRRAVSAAERKAGLDAALEEAQRQRIDALRRARGLELHCDPAAVLIVWR